MAWYCWECKTLAPASVTGGRPMVRCPKCSADAWQWVAYSSGTEGLTDLPGQPRPGSQSAPGLGGLDDLPRV
jgi:hypothetical protein